MSTLLTSLSSFLRSFSIAIGREGGVAPLIALARSDSEVRVIPHPEILP